MMYDFWHILHVIMEFSDREQFFPLRCMVDGASDTFAQTWLTRNNAKAFGWINIAEVRGNCLLQKLHRSGNFCDVAPRVLHCRIYDQYAKFKHGFNQSISDAFFFFFSFTAFCGTFSDAGPPEHRPLLCDVIDRIIPPWSHILYLCTLTHVLPTGEEKDRAHLFLWVTAWSCDGIQVQVHELTVTWVTADSESLFLQRVQTLPSKAGQLSGNAPIHVSMNECCKVLWVVRIIEKALM